LTHGHSLISKARDFLNNRLCTP